MPKTTSLDALVAEVLGKKPEAFHDIEVSVEKLPQEQQTLDDVAETTIGKALVAAAQKVEVDEEVDVKIHLGPLKAEMKGNGPQSVQVILKIAVVGLIAVALIAVFKLFS